MSRYLKPILFVVLIALLVGVGLAWFDYLQITNTGVLLSVQRIVNSEIADELGGNGQLVLEEERLKKVVLAVDRDKEQLEIRERTILNKERQLEQWESELMIFQEQLEKQETNLILNAQEFENRREVIEQNVMQLNSIPPTEAASIIAQYDDQLIVETFIVADSVAENSGTPSLVPLWLSLLPSDRAASVHSKSVIKYGEQ